MSDAIETTHAGAETHFLEGVSFSRPDLRNRVVLSTPEGPVLRLPSRLALLLEEIQTAPDQVESIRREFGLEKQEFEAIVSQIRARIPKSPEKRLEKRFRYEFPLTFKVTIFDPSRFFSYDSWISRALRTRAGWNSFFTCGILGLLMSLCVVMMPGGPLQTTITAREYLLAGAALLVCTAVHEFAHAAVLASAGGHPRRMGVMLFYLAPAFFCDVKDSWNIAPRLRLRVALAGMIAQGNISLILSILSLMAHDKWTPLLGTIAVTNSWSVIMNLIPFIKLDGYVALAGYLDRPGLRGIAIARANEFVQRIVYGQNADTATERDYQDDEILIIFGLACILFPALFVVGISWQMAGATEPLGRVSPALALVTMAMMLLVLLRAALKHAREAFESGFSRWRIVSVWIAILCASTGFALAVPVRQPAVAAGVFSGNNGQLVLGSLSPITGEHDGSVRARLHSPSLSPTPEIASATTVGTSKPCEIPLSAVAPISDGKDRLAGFCTPVRVSGQSDSSPDLHHAETMLASVNRPRLTLFNIYLNDAKRLVQSGK